MKQLFTLLALIMALSCTKSISEPDQSTDQNEFYRVLAIGEDTSTSKVLFAREQSISNWDEDDYARIEILGYVDGEYLLQVTNKQNCKMDFKLQYIDVVITNITPDRKNNLEYNQIGAGKTEVFKLKGDPKLGKIKFKVLTVCEWCSRDPKWLSVDITPATLPITFIHSSAQRSKLTGEVTINFEIDDPVQIKTFIIQKSTDGLVFTNYHAFNCNPNIKSYSVTLQTL